MFAGPPTATKGIDDFNCTSSWFSLPSSSRKASTNGSSSKTVLAAAKIVLAAARTVLAAAEGTLAEALKSKQFKLMALADAQKKQERREVREAATERAVEEEYEEFCAEAWFRIQILEQRLARHEDQALQKFAYLDTKLRNDPRLSAIHDYS